MIKNWLADVGIQISLKLVDRVTSDQPTTEGKYDLALVGFGRRAGDPDTLRGLFSSNSKAEGFTQVRGYRNERFDELAAKQRKTVDEAARREMVDEMQAILAEDVPTIALYYPNSKRIFDKTVLDAWYYTPCGIASGIPMTRNKQLFVIGRQTGFEIKEQ